jgi:hypothetical protein
MTVRIGELTSQVEVAGAPAGGAPPASGAPPRPEQPSWEERERHRRLAEDDRSRRARVAGEGFDG